MDCVYLLWVDVYDWPENGGGRYLVSIYANKEDADKVCEKLNRKSSPDEKYFVDKGVIK